MTATTDVSDYLRALRIYHAFKKDNPALAFFGDFVGLDVDRFDQPPGTMPVSELGAARIAWLLGPHAQTILKAHLAQLDPASCR